MARPREFDENDVLERALATFWEKGFDGTSIDDLVEATGLGRASLYGAFGDKKRLFERVLAHYCARFADLPRRLEEAPSARIALEQLMRGWVLQVRPRSGPRGCFLLLAGVADEPKCARESLTSSLAHIEKLVAELVRQGQASGELATTADPVDVARMLVVLHQGLATSARAGWSSSRLDSAIEAALALLVGPAPPRE